MTSVKTDFQPRARAFADLRDFKISNSVRSILKEVIKLKELKLLQRSADFSSREWEGSKTKVGKEYCWAITQAAGRSCGCRSGSRISGDFPCICFDLRKM